MDTIVGITVCLIISFVPALFYAYLVYWTDRYEKEPLLLLGGVFLWGAIVAAGAAYVVNTLLGAGVYLFTGSEAAANLTTRSLIAPVVEELLKGFAALIVFLAFRQEFDTIIDGIVYAAITALGFSATENAYYIFSYGYKEHGALGIVALFILRVLLVGWQHPFYTAFTGIGLAVSRLNRNQWIKLGAPIIGLGMAMLTHSAHNTMASFLTGLPGLAAILLVDWSGWVIMFFFAMWALSRERQWIREHLREEVELGVISQAHYRVACSSSLQLFARLMGMFTGQYSVTLRFYQLTADLAYKKHQRATLGEEAGNTPIIERLRSRVALMALYARV